MEMKSNLMITHSQHLIYFDVSAIFIFYFLGLSSWFDGTLKYALRHLVYSERNKLNCQNECPNENFSQLTKNV